MKGEAPKERCNYCIETKYHIEECPKKQENKQKQDIKNLNEPSQTNLTYAKKVTFTPISSQSEFLHPSTKLKLNKKAIENNRLNFPPLKPSKPTHNKEKTQLIYSNNLSLNICAKKSY